MRFVLYEVLFGRKSRCYTGFCCELSRVIQDTQSGVDLTVVSVGSCTVTIT